ncbi:unnamed protein product [Protopolystoma xenopodis]|uniref:Uncharacterized protein n=1 Tax=Protopolystoma xenopodis TaxID=117903 RepID=A0A448X3L0_9PLAT|nr:unnamed protein product [Protopolystoma xenopodis]
MATEYASKTNAKTPHFGKDVVHPPSRTKPTTGPDYCQLASEKFQSPTDIISSRAAQLSYLILCKTDTSTADTRKPLKLLPSQMARAKLTTYPHDTVKLTSLPARNTNVLATVSTSPFCRADTIAMATTDHSSESQAGVRKSQVELKRTFKGWRPVKCPNAGLWTGGEGLDIAKQVGPKVQAGVKILDVARRENDRKDVSLRSCAITRRKEEAGKKGICEPVGDKCVREPAKLDIRNCFKPTQTVETSHEMANSLILGLS